MAASSYPGPTSSVSSHQPPQDALYRSHEPMAARTVARLGRCPTLLPPAPRRRLFRPGPGSALLDRAPERHPKPCPFALESHGLSVLVRFILSRFRQTLGPAAQPGRAPSWLATTRHSDPSATSVLFCKIHVNYRLAPCACFAVLLQFQHARN